MPELPEVERFRLLLEPLVTSTTSTDADDRTGSRVTIQCLDESHKGINLNMNLVVKGASSNKINKENAPSSSSSTNSQSFPYCKSVRRKGKQICLEFITASGQDQVLCLHMGMTGQISVPGVPENWGDGMLLPVVEPAVTTTTTTTMTETMDDTPRFAYVLLSTSSYRAYFCDPRKFGKVYFTKSVDSVFDSLAPDAMECSPNDDAIVSCLANQRLGVKALLLDQKRVVSGVGNWVADEVFYQVRMHPEQTYLTNAEARHLLVVLQSILVQAVAALKSNTHYPKNWLFPYRWSSRKKQQVRDGHGQCIHFIKVGGRTSAIIPHDQTLQKRQKPILDTDDQEDDLSNTEARTGDEHGSDINNRIVDGRKSLIETSLTLPGDPPSLLKSERKKKTAVSSVKNVGRQPVRKSPSRSDYNHGKDARCFRRMGKVLTYDGPEHMMAIPTCPPGPELQNTMDPKFRSCPSARIFLFECK